MIILLTSKVSLDVEFCCIEIWMSLSEVFFKFIDESKSSQIAVSVIFNIIKYVYSNNDKYKLEIEKELETNSEFNNIALWKMKVIKLV